MTTTGIFLRVLPRCWACYDCGYFIKVDEDGCCAICGRDAHEVDSEYALRRMKEGA